MKTVKIELPDEDAEALERAAIDDIITAPIACDPDALARDVAAHKAAKRRGDAGLTPEEARAGLEANRSA
jgi:hypothetical protein